MYDEVTEVSIEQQIAQMIMIGFTGINAEDKEVRIIANHLSDNTLGSVILYGDNIENHHQLVELSNYFKAIDPDIIIATDQEGGLVQRLTSKKGFNQYPTAMKITEEENPKDIYRNMARELHQNGINMNFGPIVDLHHEQSKIIAKYERSYSCDANEVTKYAEIFIDAHRENKVLTCVKHFPGHGLVAGDSHQELPDATEFATSQELEPYYELMSRGKIDMVMTAHIMNRNLDSKYPATLSPIILKTLLRDKGYDGVIISDDLFMAAIVLNYSLEESVILAIKAGCDMLIYSNNKQACKFVENAHPDININLKIIDIVKNAISSGEILKETIEKSYQRIMKLKESIR